jgi:GT2 family glycosyltransferase
MARNKGAFDALGSLLIFIDDDVRLLPDAIERHRAFHLHYTNAIAFGFLEMDPVFAAQRSFWSYRREIEQLWRKGHPTEITFANFAITSANLSMSRMVFEQLNGFNNDLRDSEDFDFCVRALLQEIQIRYVPEIRGYHDDFSDIGAYLKRQEEYLLSKYMLLL